MLNLIDMGSATAPPSCSSWPALSSCACDQVLMSAKRLPFPGTHEMTVLLITSTPHSMGRLTAQRVFLIYRSYNLTARINHFCYQGLGNSQTLLLLLEIRPRMPVSHSFGNLQRQHFCTTVSVIPSIPSRNHHLSGQYNTPTPAGAHVCAGYESIRRLLRGHCCWQTAEQPLRALAMVNIPEADLSSQLLALLEAPTP